jgi:hypothetical protein
LSIDRRSESPSGRGQFVGVEMDHVVVVPGGGMTVGVGGQQGIDRVFGWVGAQHQLDREC